MIDTKMHYISIDPEILNRNWGRYRLLYQNVEAQLPRYAQVQAPFAFKTHHLGGFFVRRDVAASPLKELFEDPNEKYLLQLKGKYYSRGLAYYPGLYSEKTDAEKIALIISKSQQIVKAFTLSDQHTVYSAIAQDYLRNYLLILYHAFHSIAYRQSLLSARQEDLDQLNNQFKGVLLNVELALFRYILGKDTTSTIPALEIEVHLARMKRFFRLHERVISEEFRGKKLIREVREMDSLAHIYLFAQALASRHLTSHAILLGMEYGGIELPFAVNAARIIQNKQKLFAMTLKVSNYSDKSFVPRKINDLLIFESERQAFSGADSVWILDDSITTGRTLQRMVKLLTKGEAVYVGAVTFKVSNRYHHLTMPEHGGFNPVVARNSLLLCQANYSSTYRRNSYLGRSGVFDINKHNLYRLLGKDLV